MELKLPAEVKTIMSKMNNAGYEIYVVGGAVRDLLTGKIVTDWDYTTNATPESIQEVFPSSFYDNSFGTVGIPSLTKSRPSEPSTVILILADPTKLNGANHSSKISSAATLRLTPSRFPPIKKLPILLMVKKT